MTVTQSHRLGRGLRAVDNATAKVVMMELVTANEPLSAPDLSERTLLSETAIRPVLEELAAAGLCSVLPADGPRSLRFEARRNKAQNSI